MKAERETEAGVSAGEGQTAVLVGRDVYNRRSGKGGLRDRDPLLPLAWRSRLNIACGDMRVAKPLAGRVVLDFRYALGIRDRAIIRFSLPAIPADATGN